MSLSAAFPRHRRPPATLLLAALLLPGCRDSPVDPPDGAVVAGVDMGALFAPPTSAERGAVEADWAARSPDAEGFEQEEEESVDWGGGEVRVRVVSHLVDGHRHFGAILGPVDEPDAPLPVLVYTHGGDGGISLATDVFLVASALGLSTDDFVIVVPSFRSEPLRFGGRSWHSEGPPSPWDRDVDDALSLVEVALATTPFADGERIGVLGLSRGGAVGLLMGVRDPRIAAVVSYFAPTDFFGPFVEEVFRETLLGRPPGLPGTGFLVTEIVEPLKAGALSLDEVRLELLRRSSARFADRLPAVQIHHGTADVVVPVEEAEHLMAQMDALGRGPPDFDFHIYSGAGHNPLQMPQSLPRTRSFLATFVEGASSAARAAPGSGSVGPSLPRPSPPF